MSFSQPSEVAILGGGLAGSAAAITLARAGRSVTLIERERHPHHKVCGEFLSVEALQDLAALNIDIAALGAVPVSSVRFNTTTAPLPFAAMSLTRKRLDEALLQQAAAAGAQIIQGLTASALNQHSDHWQAQLSDGSHLTATTVFLATGKHDLRGHPRPASLQSDLTGFKMYFHLAPAQQAALARQVELYPYPGGYAGLQPVEDGAANLCCLINRRGLHRLRGDWQLLLAHMQRHNPQLATRLRSATPLLPKPLAISAIPYGFLRDRTEPNLWCLGDQAAVIPSFTGDGMSIALHSGCLAAQMYLQNETAETFQRRLRESLTAQVGFATKISRALLHPLPRTAMQAAVKLWPAALGHVAKRTRISSPLP